MGLTKINLTVNECKQILNDVKQGKTSFVQIGKKYNVSNGTIVNQLKKNIPEEYIKYSKERIFNVTEEQCKYLFEKYKNGTSLREIGKEVHKDKGTIKKILLKHGYNIEETKRYGRISDYNIDESFFENIDTEEKAYWLGFFLGDGYITKDNKSIELALQKQDKEHVEKFKKVLNSSNKIAFKEKVNAYKFSCSSEKLCKDLNKHGVFNNKSLTFTLNEEILFSKFGRHYLRGLIDANGTIHLDKNNCYIVALTCNELVAKQFKKYINIFKERNINYKTGSKAVDIRVYSSSAILFIRYLYKNANIYLERKYNKAFAVLESVVNSKKGFQEVLVG